MRALVLLFGIALAACSPEIESGVYFCGPDQACPDGFSCDGETNTCVTPTEVMPFSCSEGGPLVAPTCDPSTLGSSGCVDTAGAHDMMSFTTAAGCPMNLDIMITYPVAFMPLEAQVSDGNASQGTTQPCHAVHAGLQDACVTLTANPGTTYTVDVAAVAGGDTCNGACAFNRYQLAVQVTRP
jgi:hypothetical protein